MATLGLNGVSISGAFSRNSNATLPDSSISYEDVVRQSELHVPQTGPKIPTIGNCVATEQILDGTRWIVLKNPNGNWNDSEIFAPPDEYLAKKDLEKQKSLEKKMLSNMSDEQKELLRRFESGEITEKSKLIEESKRT